MTQASLISLFDSVPLWVMVLPLFICSVLLVAVFIERMIFFRTVSRNIHDLLEGIVGHLKKKEFETVQAILAERKGPVVDLILEMTVRRRLEVDEVLLHSYGDQALKKIERFTGLVSTIATIAPMLGLLGTVTGMMKSFSALSVMGGAAQELLAGGITEALITTALGLIIAIPALIFYNYLVTRNDQGARDVELVINRLSSIEPGKK